MAPRKPKDPAEEAIKIDAMIEALSREGFDFFVVGYFHYRYRDFDFWPTTGRYYEAGRPKSGRGLPRLLRRLRKRYGDEVPTDSKATE